MVLRPLYDIATRGGGEIDTRARWALEWRSRLLPVLAARLIRPVGRTVDVRIYSDECTTGGGMAAVALPCRQEGDFTVLLEGAAEQLLLESLEETRDPGRNVCDGSSCCALGRTAERGKDVAFCG